jgi:2-hydroxy-6-oxonona-2,4-dienedioate hydrolase
LFERFVMGRMSLSLDVVLIVAVAAAGFISLSYRGEIAKARAVARSGGQILDTMAGRIEYAERGAGIPLLSIHGAGGGYDQGLANAAEFVGDGFRVIAPSRFGYLGTPIPQDISPAAQADALSSLLHELKIERTIVVGVSAGARSALEITLRHPEEAAALVLIVPGTYAPVSPVQIEESRGSRFAFWLVNAGADFAWWAAESVASSMLIRFLGVDPKLVGAAPRAERDRVMRIVRSVQPLSLRFAGINIDSKPDLHPLPLGQIRVPTLVIAARDDLFNTLPAAQFVAEAIPNAELVVYETGGHLLVGREMDVRTVIGRFLVKAGLAPAQSP